MLNFIGGFLVLSFIIIIETYLFIKNSFYNIFSSLFKVIYNPFLWIFIPLFFPFWMIHNGIKENDVDQKIGGVLLGILWVAGITILYYIIFK